MRNSNDKLGWFSVLQYHSKGYKNDTSDSKKEKFTKEEIGEIKRKFAENCGQWNTEHPNQEIVIRFKAEGNDLVPSNPATFDKWFLTKEEAKKSFHQNTLDEASVSGTE